MTKFQPNQTIYLRQSGVPYTVLAHVDDRVWVRRGDGLRFDHSADLFTETDPRQPVEEVKTA